MALARVSLLLLTLVAFFASDFSSGASTFRRRAASDDSHERETLSSAEHSQHQMDFRERTHSAHNSRRSSRLRRWAEDVTTIQFFRTSLNNLQSRAQCSWTYTYNVDPLRQPSRLVQAICNTVILTGTTDQCAPVMYYVPVRYNVSGVMQDQYQWLSVGCTRVKVTTPPPVTYN